MLRKIFYTSSIALMLMLSGCGGGGSSDKQEVTEGGGNNPDKEKEVVEKKPTDPVKQKVGGFIIDAAIKNAKVSMICDKKQLGNISTTDNNGEFDIQTNTIDDRTKCNISSTGGEDVSDGDSFENITLKAPLELFSGTQKAMVTPITTLVQIKKESGVSIEDAKKSVSEFLGISIDNIAKNPMSDKKLQKITKKLAKIATFKDNNGKVLGFTKLASSSDNNLSVHVKNIKNVDTSKLEALMKTLDGIDEAETIEEITKESITSNVLNLLKEAYGKSSNYKVSNLEILTEKIVEANKKGDIYKPVNRQKFRKALKDVGLVPTFEDDDVTLSSNIKSILVGSEKSFKEYLSNKTIDILDTDGIVIYDTSKSKKILKDNASRVEYYTFSNKSHIAKALKMLEGSYDDTLLDPSYVQIARGYAKLGFDYEARKAIDENVYDEYYKIDGKLNIANILISQNKKSAAKTMLDGGYNTLKLYLVNKGATNLDSDDSWLVLGYYIAYYNAGYSAKADEVMDFFDKNIVSQFATVTTYGRMVVQYRNIMQDLIDNNKADEARVLFKKATRFALGIPHTKKTSRSVSFNLLMLALIGPVLDETDATNQLLNRMTEMDNTYGTTYGLMKAPKDSNGTVAIANNAGHISAIKAMNGELPTIMNTISTEGGIFSWRKVFNFDTYKLEWKMSDETETAMEEGVVVAMFKEGNKTGAIDMLYKYRPFKDTEKTLGNQIMRKYAPLKYRFSLDVGRLLKAYDKINGTKLMVEFYEMLVDDMKTRPWNDLSDKAISKYILHQEYGIPVIIRHFHSANQITKRDKMLEGAVNIVNNMTDPIHKTSAIQSIMDVVDDLNLPKNANITSLISDLDATVNKITLNPADLNSANTKTKYYNDFTAVVTQSKYSALYSSINTSKKLIQRAKAGLPVAKNGNKTSIETKLKYAIGSIEIDKWGRVSDRYNQFLLSAMVQAKDFKNAEKLIDEISSDVASLGDSLDANLDYVAIARSYAAINNAQKAKATIDKIKTLQQKKLAIKLSIKYLSNFDSFENSSIASVDTDGDGKPDFFSLTASDADIKASGLTLDDDIDGDGVSVESDNYPYDSSKH